MTRTLRGDGEDSIEFAIDVACLMDSLHCTDVTVLDLRGLSQITDVFIIGSGTSNRQMKSVADDVEELGEERGKELFRRHIDPQVTWIALDFVGVVVHLFEPEVRAYYDLEMLWGDGKRITWRKAANDDRHPDS